MSPSEVGQRNVQHCRARAEIAVSGKRTDRARTREASASYFMSWCVPTSAAVYFAAFSILQNESDAEDVAQETVLKALKNLASFRGEAKFGTWLVSIAINEARARLRHDKVLKFESVDAVQQEEDGCFVPEVLSDWREVPSEAWNEKRCANCYGPRWSPFLLSTARF